MNLIKTTGLTVLVAASTLVTSCADDGPTNNETATSFRPLELTQSTRSATSANNGFALDLFRHASGSSKTVMSPYGAFSVLAMLANGDNAKSRDEILAKFGLTDNEEALKALNDY